MKNKLMHIKRYDPDKSIKFSFFYHFPTKNKTKKKRQIKGHF